MNTNFKYNITLNQHLKRHNPYTLVLIRVNAKRILKTSFWFKVDTENLL